MSYKTVEVELENGHVRPAGPELLPAKARALLTLLDFAAPSAARTCSDLAERWSKLERLPSDEASVFADDIERGRAALPPLKPAWD
jgi:hypothetical protein